MQLAVHKFGTNAVSIIRHLLARLRSEPALMFPQVKIKICCINSQAEADLAISCGADTVGLVSAMPSGPGVITEDLIASIAKAVSPNVQTFLLTSCQTAGGIFAQHQRCRTNTIQICDRLERCAYLDLRKSLPGITLVQVIHVHDENSVNEAVAIAPCVDALLLDSGNQSLAVKQLGGTGRVHNWNFSRDICRNVRVPVFLAGGLSVANITDAIETVRPSGVDVCRGVRSDGNLDINKLRAFVSAVRST